MDSLAEGEVAIRLAADVEAVGVRFFLRLYEDLRRKGALSDVDPAAFVAVPRAAMALTLERSLIGPSFPALVDLLVESLALRLAAG